MSAQPEPTPALAIGSPVTVDPAMPNTPNYAKTAFIEAKYQGWVIDWDGSYYIVSTSRDGKGGGWDYFFEEELTLRKVEQ
jgi:hypothetical protein